MNGDLPRHEPRAGLYDSLLAGYRLTPGERRTGLWLLKLLSLPGMGRLMLAWHARRARRR